MFVPFCNPDDAGRKTDGADGTCEQSRVIILYLVFYMPMNVLLYSGYLTEYSDGTGRSSMWTEQVHGQLIGKLSFQL